jgi:hypothetical protein
MPGMEVASSDYVTQMVHTILRSNRLRRQKRRAIMFFLARSSGGAAERQNG